MKRTLTKFVLLNLIALIASEYAEARGGCRAISRAIIRAPSIKPSVRAPKTPSVPKTPSKRVVAAPLATPATTPIEHHHHHTTSGGGVLIPFAAGAMAGHLMTKETPARVDATVPVDTESKKEPIEEKKEIFKK
jgi:hypothetical protein